MELGDALAWLDRHQNLERMLGERRAEPPDPSRMRSLVDVLGHPESASPVVHVTGTNGKTSTSRAITTLLMAKGLTVGTYTSPHLERINERLSINDEPISDHELAEVLSDLAAVEPLVAGGPATWFELMTAAALRWFADRPVDVAVVEVGIGGRWDATNVVDADVAVVTSIGLDHTELLGPTREHVAAEKAGIVKAGSTLVLAERDAGLLPIFEREAARRLWWVDRDFAVTRNDLGVGGRVLDIRTPGATYEGVWLSLHGRHQGANFATALAAAEAFFGKPVEEALVREAAGAMRSPGRLEVVRRRPVVVLDGAKNADGASRAAAAVAEEFASVRRRVLVVGMLQGKDPAEMLDALHAGEADLVVTCAPASPRAQPSSVVAAAARRTGAEVVEEGTVEEAVAAAVASAHPDDVILVTGSLYVVGAARGALGGG